MTVEKKSLVMIILDLRPVFYIVQTFLHDKFQLSNEN